MVEQLKFSVNQVSTYHWSVYDDLVHYQLQGFDALGLWTRKLSEFDHDSTLVAIQESGLEVSSLGYLGNLIGLNDADFEESRYEAAQWFQWAEQVNAAVVQVVSGPQDLHIRPHATRILRSRLKSLANLASQHRITLALKPMHPVYAKGWTFLNTLQDTLEVIDACDHPGIQLSLGTVQLASEENLIELIPSLLSHTALLQISDAPRSFDDPYGQVLPDKGDVPLRDILQTVLDCNFQGYCEFDIWSEEVWNSNYARMLKHCRAFADSVLPSPTDSISDP